MSVARIRHLLNKFWYAALALACGAATADTLTDDERFVVANARFVVLHEMGHLLLNELRLPIFGREEDAADQLAFSAFFVLPDYRDDPALTTYLMDVTRYWRLQGLRDKPKSEKIEPWDSHSIDLQRFYNLACLTYGSDPDTMQWVLQQTGLPVERALYCDQEYQQALYSLQWIKQHYKRDKALPKMPISVNYGQISHALEPEAAFIEKVRLNGELEAIAARASSDFALPRPLSINAQSCSTSDAWFDRQNGEIILCYEYLLHLREVAQTKLPEAPKAPELIAP